MRRSRAAALIGVLAAAVLATSAHARVVLIGIDGGSWPLLDRGMQAGELPAFTALAVRGATAEMETVEPVISPVVWTSIATGRSPVAHGVRDFLRNRTHIRVPTVFERLAAHGLRVGLQEYLITWPPRPLPGGFMIPAWLRRDERVEPSDVFARAGLAPYTYAVDDATTLDHFAALARRETTTKADHFLRLADAFELDVGAVTFYAADATGHRFWRADFPDEFDTPRTAAEERFPHVIRDTLRGIDASIGRIVAALGPDDAIVVVSDHGFQAEPDPRRIWSLRLEAQLAAAGLEPERDGFSIDGTFFATTLRVLPGPFAQREATLERLQAFFESAHGPDGEPLLGVEVVDVAERPPDATRALLTRLRQWGVRLVVERFFGIRLDEPAHAYLFAQPNDAALSALWPDGEIRLGDRTLPASTLFSVDDFTGRHHETAIFLAAGGPIARVTERARVSVLDVAPLLLYLAGQPVPDDLEGRVPVQLLDPARLAAQPVRIVPASELPGLPAAPAGAEVDDRVLRERLRALGYAE